MRKVEYFLITVVAVFLSVVLPIFNKDNVMDFGTTSDIASAIGTLGTLAVAFMVYRKAPEWLHQKMDEHAFNIAKDLIVSDFPKIQNTLKECAGHFDYFSTCYDVFDAQESFKDLIRLTTDRNKLLSDLELAYSRINSNIDSLIKLGWTLKPSIYQLYMHTNKYHLQCISTIKEIYSKMDEVQIYLNKPVLNDEIFNRKVLLLTKLCSIFKKNHMVYSEYYSEFFHGGGTVPEYFDIKTIRIIKNS